MKLSAKTKIEELKAVIKTLHGGASVDDVREKFSKIIGGAEAGEIAEMEQQLISDGLPVEEVQRLCDVHVGAFKQALDEQKEVEVPPGHPVHTYMKENERIAELANELGDLVRGMSEASGGKKNQLVKQIREVVDDLSGIDNHYARKENQLFPFLEKHGIDGPPKVMWGVHDEIRATYKKVREASLKGNTDDLVPLAPKLARDIAEMIYKENKILFPMALENLTEDEWKEVRRGEDELGYAYAKPDKHRPEKAPAAAQKKEVGAGLLSLETGQLSLEQINLILTTMPVDISFVDENDEVRYYSEGERHFPRSPAVIGRKVLNCHPQKSVGTVQKILDAFRAGEKDVAEFWIEHGGKFLNIRYFAMRDKNGAYKGCLEVGQDVTHIRELQGEQRLLDWKADNA